MRTFNLVTEPWIPVVTTDGRVIELGIADTLTQASEIVCLAEDQASVWLGITRILVAVLQASVQPKDDKQWALTVRSGWDKKKVNSYLAKWSHRFDLLDAEAPFMQGAATDARVVGPVVKLTMVHAANSEKRLIDHSRNDDPTPLTLAQTARAILASQSSAVGGGNNYAGGEQHCLADAPCAAALNHLLRGKTLRETLALALLTPEVAASTRQATEDDRPCWERKPPEATVSNLTRDQTGYLDHLTWQTRRIRFEVEPDGLVRRAKVQQGDVHKSSKEEKAAKKAAKKRAKKAAKTAKGGAKQQATARPKNRHPLALYREEKTGLGLVKARPGTPAWLNALAAATGASDKAPLTIVQARRGLKVDPDLLGDRVVVRVAGIDHDKAKINRFVNEEVELPTRILAVPEQEARDAIKDAESAINSTIGRMKAVILEITNPNDANRAKAARAISDEKLVSSGVLDELFASLRDASVARIAGGSVDDWQKASRLTAWRAVRKFTSSLGLSPRVIVAAAKAGAL